MKSGIKISNEMKTPIFTVLVKETNQIRKYLLQIALKFKINSKKGIIYII